MRHPRWPLLIVAAFYLAASPLVRAEKEHSPSHVPVPIRPGSTDPEEIFKERLAKAQLLHNLPRNVKDQLKGESLEDLLKKFKATGIDPNSPEFAELIKKQMTQESKTE